MRGNRDPKHDRIDQHSQNSAHLWPAPVRHPDSDTYVSVTAVQVQERNEGGKENGELTHAFAPSERCDPSTTGVWQSRAKSVSSKGERHRAPSIARQIETGWGAIELMLPVLGLLRRFGSGRPGLLPDCKVCELNREIRQLSRLIGYRRPIQLDEFGEQQVERPSVVNQMVLGMQQDVGAIGDAIQRPANERQPIDLEWSSDFLAHEAIEFGSARGIGQSAQIDDGKGKWVEIVVYEQVWSTGAIGLERRPVDLVPPHDRAQASLQDARIQIAFEAERRLKCIGERGRTELVNEPHPLLR
jgi:hypothetical protein